MIEEGGELPTQSNECLKMEFLPGLGKGILYDIRVETPLA
jgi:hypothetical protein